MHNQVVIIGGGPSGTLLALILAKANIDVLVLERMTKEYVLSRIRAGVLEWNTVDMLMKNGVGKRMSAEGQVHEGTFLSSSNKQFRIDFKNTINKQVMVYGQTEVTFDLYKELEKHKVKIIHEVDDVEIKDLTKERNNEKKAERKRIKKERKESEEHAELKAMPRGKERGELFDAFHKETKRLVKERHDEIEADFEKKLNYRKIGGDASGLTMVGEDGPEIVDFKTAVNVVPAHRTQETLKTLGESGGTNVITMDLPPITTPAPEVNVGAPPANTEQDIPSINPFNTYMVLTPEILKIS